MIVGSLVKVHSAFNNFKIGDIGYVVDTYYGEPNSEAMYLIIPLNKKLCALTGNCLRCREDRNYMYCGMILFSMSFDIVDAE